MLAAVLIARSSDIQSARSVTVFIVSFVAFVIVCEHLIPMAIVRRDPEDVLDVLLPVFTPLARLLTPDDGGARRGASAAASANGSATAPPNGAPVAAAASAPRPPPTKNDISEEEGRELLQSIVDFTETVVKEVMTPRPDIVAVAADSPLQDLRAVFREEQYSRMPVYRDNLDNIVGVVFVKDLVGAAARRRAAADDADAGGLLSCRRASACRTC